METEIAETVFSTVWPLFLAAIFVLGYLMWEHDRMIRERMESQLRDIEVQVAFYKAMARYDAAAALKET